MARIDTLEFIIDGQKFKSNVNVNKAGIFSIVLDLAVAHALGFEKSKLESGSLKELISPIIDKYNAFKESKRTFEAFIGIRFGASGCYFDYTRFNRDFSLNSYSTEIPKIGFDFGIYVKEENINGECWHEAKLLSETNESYFKDFNGSLRSERIFDKFYLDRRLFNRKPHVEKMIKYSDESLETLKQAQDRLKSLSSKLIEFLSQDETDLEKQLFAGSSLKLLS